MSESERRALRTAVIGGMLASTILAVFFVPVFFVVFQRLGGWRSGPPPVQHEHPSVAITEDGHQSPAVATATSAGHGVG